MLKPLQALLARSRRKPDHVARIDHPEIWAGLCARHGYQTARTETVKVVIDVANGHRPYFFNSTKWETHYDFVLRHVDPRANFDRFIYENYENTDRRYILCSLIHYADGDHWTLELAVNDNLSAERITALHAQMRACCPFVPKLHFLAISPDQIQLAQRLDERVPVLSRDAINATMKYQPVVLGTAWGHLRIVRGKLDVSTLRPYDIVVSEEVPDAIPPVAALITSQLQAPLAHVAVLSRNRNTPDMAVRGAVDLESFQSLEGQVVKLVVAGQDYQIAPTPLAEAEAAWARMRPRQAFSPQRDLGVRGLQDVRALPPGAEHIVGAKTAQLARLDALDGIATPGGWGLPFAHYDDHLRASGAATLVEALLTDAECAAHGGLRAQRLAAIRAAIETHPVDAGVLDAIMQCIQGDSVHERWILRSSTNAEDLAGFNGAGLYESIPTPPRPDRQQVADVLRTVWASVWLQRAYEERDWYRIDHAAVAMGVLLQPFVRDAVASGVAITGNPFKQGLDAYFINTQTMASSVTGAQGNELPEQHLIEVWSAKFDIELLSHSTLTGGQAILQSDELMALATQLRSIHEHLLPPYRPVSNAMDVEFVLDAQRRFTIVQARPYTIVYSFDRARPDRKLTFAMRVGRVLRRTLFDLKRRNAPAAA